MSDDLPAAPRDQLIQDMSFVNIRVYRVACAGRSIQDQESSDKRNSVSLDIPIIKKTKAKDASTPQGIFRSLKIDKTYKTER